MSKGKKHHNLDKSQIIGAIIFIVLIISLILLGLTYDPDGQYTSSFFEDVSNAIQWKD